MPDRPSVVRPRLGNVQSEWGYHNGQPALILRDALGLSPAAIALPQSLALLAALCDGTRDLAGLRASLMVRAGVLLSEEQLGGILAQMDEALLFENGRQGAALAERLAAYRAAPQRAPICAGGSYPADPAAASAALDSYAGAPLDLPRPAEELRGLVSPHIDYPRGGEVYAAVWRAAAPALAAADLVVILGTDHHGPPGSVTLTAQSYATPWGILPTDAGAVEWMASAVGPEAFTHELNHTAEHSVELAAIWLRYVAPAAGFHILPVLIGSFAPFVEGADPDAHLTLAAALRALRELGGTRRVFWVAAADLAHMGPAFSGEPVDAFARQACRLADASLLGAICAGDHVRFLAEERAEGDRRHICGLPPIYMLLRTLEPAAGIPAGYAQCPADDVGTSIVSVAGALLW